MSRLQLLYQTITSTAAEKGYVIVSDLKTIYNSKCKITYVCKCGTERTVDQRTMKDGTCADCKVHSDREEAKINPLVWWKSEGQDITRDDGVYKKFKYVWVRSDGFVVSSKNGKELIYRATKMVTIDGLNYLRPRIVALAFKIPNYKLLESRTNESGQTVRSAWTAEVIDNTKEMHPDNLQVISVSQQLSQMHAERDYSETVTIPPPYNQRPHKCLAELPHWCIFEDGKIFNNVKIGGSKWITGELLNNRVKARTHASMKETTIYDLATVVYMAYHPCQTHPTYAEFYNDFHVYHSDNNIWNFKLDNLQMVKKEKKLSIVKIIQQNVQNRIEKIKQSVQEFVQSRNGTLITPIDDVCVSNDKFSYNCACGEIFTKAVKDIDSSSNCQKCMSKMVRDETDDQSLNFERDGDVYFKIKGGWMSRSGVVLNSSKEVAPVHKHCVKLLGAKLFNVKHLMAKTFKINNHEYLCQPNTYVGVINGQREDYRLENLIVVLHTDDQCSSQAYEEDISGVKSVVLQDEFPNYVFYENGVIREPTGKLTKGHFTNKRFKCIVNNFDQKGYRHIHVHGKNYPFHRLICYAFNPRSDFGHNGLNLYKNLDVNHKTVVDRKADKANNHASNLEWCTRSQNVQHLFDNGLCKSALVVNCFKTQNGQKAEFFKKYMSLTSASRECKMSTSQIKNICNGKVRAKNFWFEWAK